MNQQEKETERKFHFDVIRRNICSRCVSEMGREELLSWGIMTEKEKIEQRMGIIMEIRDMMKVKDLRLEGLEDVTESLTRLKIEGAYLEEVELANIERVINLCAKWKNGFRNSACNMMRDCCENVPDGKECEKIIREVLDEKGQIKDDVSIELAKFRRNIRDEAGRVGRIVNGVLQRAIKDGYAENGATVTIRDGRMTIPINPYSKKYVNGVVVDESDSGRTLYIEPQETVEIDNRLRVLKAEERREILRILLQVAILIRPYRSEILEIVDFLKNADAWMATAEYVEEIDGVKPEIRDVPMINLRRARHPILEEMLRREGKDIVPLDINLDSEKYRILVLSGPNAGGKSVCLKTVGLLQYMAQCGIPIPVEEGSRIGIFERIMIDIGDNQSMEDDLSTYSSHLLNMKKFLRKSSNKTLILIDELGSGTEPKIGGAIAEALLDGFNQKKTLGIVTTHYENLKHMAEERDGLQNGAMLYDRHKLQPLFCLQQGRPGSSFAVEIARKIGLPQGVLDYAIKRVGQDYIHFDQYLQDVLRDKRYWENKRKEIQEKNKRTEDALKRYEEACQAIEKERKRILNEAKEESRDILRMARSEIENTIRRIKESRAEKEETKNARKDFEECRGRIDRVQYKEDLQKNMGVNLRKEQSMLRKEKSENAVVFQEGDIVKMEGLNQEGMVVKKGKVTSEIMVGAMKLNVSNENLIWSRNQKEAQKKVQIRVGAETLKALRNKRANFKTEIDVMGMRVGDALEVVAKYLDDAIALNVKEIRILHGTGTGSLRNAIRTYLSTIDDVEDFHDEDVRMGGAGITVVGIE